MGQLAGLSPQGSVAVGVFVGLCSTSVQSLGLTLQRKSHILEDEKDTHDLRRPPYRRRRWQLGMLMFVVANLLGSTIQITTLPLPVLSTLQASGLVFNSICAALILGEAFTRWSLAGTILVCGGAVLIAIFGAIAEPAHNLDQLLELLGRRQFVIWMIGQAILVLAIIVAARALKLLNAHDSNSPRMRLLRGMAYGCVSGILSAHSLLVAKSAVELLVRTIVDRKNQFNRWQSWASLLGLLVLALTQLYYLHNGLKLCSTSILYPFVFCVYNIIAILDGLIYFHQTSRLSVLHALLIALGTIILLAGVLALSWRLNNDHTAHHPVVQTPLTPGMGFVDDCSDVAASPTSPVSSDEESAIETRTPLLPHHYGNANGNSFTISRTPTARNNDLLRSTRALRKKGMIAPTEADEIWGELIEDSPFADNPNISSPLSRNVSRQAMWYSSQRSTSAKSTPSQRPVRDSGEGDGVTNGEAPDEHTALLGRTATGRTYRDKRRRHSAPFEQAGRPGSGSGGSGTSRPSEPWWRRWWRGKEADDPKGGQR
ncbi:MAG: DUF803 domain-containing [Lasallia pustulata]|uniref:DUF803 domain-containing n=1 Tax=Lasallia pustulata TaxID=136370 RepID=A0A5M8PYU3_9LECA|nr:MAG: DUF803 domain-containing [Lasallia pustulata]